MRACQAKRGRTLSVWCGIHTRDATCDTIRRLAYLVDAPRERIRNAAGAAVAVAAQAIAPCVVVFSFFLRSILSPLLARSTLAEVKCELFHCSFSRAAPPPPPESGGAVAAGACTPHREAEAHARRRSSAWARAPPRARDKKKCTKPKRTFYVSSKRFLRRLGGVARAV